MHSTNTACMEEFDGMVKRFSITQGKVFDIWVEAHHPLLSFREGEEGVVYLGDVGVDIPTPGEEGVKPRDYVGFPLVHCSLRQSVGGKCVDLDSIKRPG